MADEGIVQRMVNALWGNNDYTAQTPFAERWGGAVPVAKPDAIYGSNNFPLYMESKRRGWVPQHTVTLDSSSPSDNFNDQPTFSQKIRDRIAFLKKDTSESGDPNVLPPPEFDGENKGRVISPDRVMDPTFNPSTYMPTSYGAGKYKIYTPAMSGVMNMMKPSIPTSPPPDAIQKLLDALKGKE